MPEIKNNFLQGKMNKDLDERIVPKGEYLEAQNISLSESEDSDVGAIEIIKGNEKVNASITMSGSPEVIGYVRDIANRRIIYFITNFAGNDTENIRKITRAKGAGSTHSSGTAYSSSSTDNCMIVSYDIDTGSTNTLLSGAWLNFSKNHLITGVQVIDDLLFWTDDYNQPRKINIKRCLDSGGSTYYEYEDQISVAKYAPYLPIRLVNRNGYWADSNTASADVYADKTANGIASEYMKDKFIRFSYRYKYEDGEYSILAPFTQVVFEPLNNGNISETENAELNTSTFPNQPSVVVDKHTVYRTGKVNVMQNAINKVILRIPVPNINERDDTADYSSGSYSNDYKIDSIQIVIKESDGLAIKVIKTLNISELISSDFDYYQEKFASSGDTYDRQVVKYVYKSEKPYQVLPGDQISRVYDQVPLRAKALDIVGNRIVFGNYIENYDYPLDQGSKKGIDYTISSTPKGDVNHGTTHGTLRHDEFAYKFHSLKQRRTYQVGIVFADKYGRQSPVILSSSTADDADTITIDPSVSNKVALFNSAYSWSNLQQAFGLAMKINFQDTQLFNTNSNVYDPEFNAGYNPHGWYSYRLVVKQTQQEYYNVYTSHPFQNWDNIENEPSSLESNFRGKSWLALIGDNINKVPRNINDSDINRPGIAGSDVDLYPKVVYLGNTGTGSSEGGSEQNDQLHELADVISLGNAFEQSLFVSSDDNESGTGGFSVYDFVYAKDKNPLIAELANLKRYYDFGGSTDEINGQAFVAYVDKDSGTHAGGSAAADVIVQVHNSNDTSATLACPFGGVNDAVNGFVVNGTRIKNKNKPVKVLDYDTATKRVTLDTKQELKEGDYLIFSKYHEGLSVFETEPFESKIDIFYETSSCGLVQDLNEDLSNASGAGPSNIQFHTTSSGTTDVTGYAEGTNSGTLGFVKATDNDGPNNTVFYINEVKTANDVDVSNKFAINSTTGEVTIVGSTEFKGTNEDTITFKFEANDPDSSSSYAEFTINVTNSAPIFTTSSVTKEVSKTAGTNHIFYSDVGITNGASLTSAQKNNLTVSHVLGNTSFNNYFTTSINASGALIVKTSLNWTTTNANTFFGNSQGNRTMTITLNDGHSSNNTATMTIVINELANVIPITLFRNTSGLGVCDANTNFSGYVSQHNANNAPSYDGTYYTLYVGNRLFNDQNLTSPVNFLAAYYYNSASNGSNNTWNELAIDEDGTGIGTDQGEITSIDVVAECDRDDEDGL
tara:strand:+ start:3081 stop:6785 length:3705 start_codon:yes stop_codon:yes gene_type:complete